MWNKPLSKIPIDDLLSGLEHEYNVRNLPLFFLCTLRTDYSVV